VNFALVGAAGYVAPRHLRAIHETGNRLIAAVDPRDAVGVLDQYSFDVPFFTEIERFDRHLEKLRRGPEDGRVHYLSVCSPDYLHDAHCRLGLRVQSNVICEKPLVINPWNLEPIQQLEAETGRRVYTVLQLRHHPALEALKQKLEGTHDRDVTISYVAPRGRWYDVSWKGSPEKSGGIGTNIGIHFFDLAIWLFGNVVESRVYLREQRRMSGLLILERARLKWFLSVDARDLPRGSATHQAHRSIAVDGAEVEFSTGHDRLHTRVYEAILAGRGCGIDDARPSLEATYRIRTTELARVSSDAHPWLLR
jgi:UDP-N-acetyl-2-amino-2-deoxyglucuronate dehydrogenase